MKEELDSSRNGSSEGMLVGLDVGGTFTDCAVVDEDGRVSVGKALTTKANYLEGIMNAIQAASGSENNGTGELLSATSTLKHGTTVGTNSIIQRTGAKVGLLTTRGFEDTMIIMRAHGRHVDLTPEELIDFQTTDKPVPLVPRKLITGIDERIDFRGEEIVALDEDGVRAAVKAFLDDGVEAIAVSYLWSLLNPEHERRTEEIIREISEDIFVSLSSRVAPKLGEYERTAATVVNSYLGPLMSSYLGRFSEAITDGGYRNDPLIVQCAGGVISAARAVEEPLATIDSGPAAGLVGSAYLASEMNISNVVTTDMGGTSFDVGLVTDGAPVKREITVVDKFECFIPRIDVRAIGSGGGSIIWVDDAGRLNVGPESAGSDPGPAFFGRSERPTVADANMLLRFLEPEYFFGGKIEVDRAAAERAMGTIAKQLGVDDVVEVAAGVVTIIEHKMADLIRKVTIEQGYDVRDFVAFAYGGSSAIHAAAYARTLGIKQVVVPLGHASSVWSALGAATANVLQVFDKPLFMDTPLDVSAIADGFDELEKRARSQLEGDGVLPEAIQIQRFALMRHKAQVYELPIPVDENLGDLDEEKLVDSFEQRYEGLYGKGSAFPAGGITVATLRVEASGIVFKGKLHSEDLTSDIASDAHLGERDIYWPDQGKFVSTPIVRGPSLRPGNKIDGPCVIQSAETTIAVPANDVLSVDRYGSYVIDLAGHGEA